MAGEADIGIRIFLDNAASGGLGQINGQLAQMGRLLSSGNGSWAGMLIKMAPMIGLVAGIGGSFLLFGGAILYAVQQGMQLQDQMALLAINVIGARGSMDALIASIIQVADASEFSATEVTKGAVALGQMGFTAKDLLQNNHQLITSMVDLAEATGSEVAPAALLLGAAMRFFNIPASQAVQVANELDFAFHNGQPSITGLKDALQQVAPVANALGTPLRDVVLALDMLGQAGIQGSTAGVDLRYAMNNMVNPTAAASAALQSLGIVAFTHVTPALQAVIDKMTASGGAAATAAAAFSPTVDGMQALYKAGVAAGDIPLNTTFMSWAVSTGAINNQLFTANGQFRGMKPLLDALAGSMAHMSNLAKENFMHDIFGVRASQGALVLANNIQKLDSNWNTLSTRMKNTSAANDAGSMMDTLSGQMKALSTTIQNVFGMIGLIIDPVLKNMAQGLNGLLSTLTSAGGNLQRFGAIFLTVGFGLSSVAVIALIVAAAFTPLGAALLVIVGVAAAVIIGTIGISAGIAALVGWFSTAHGAATNVLNALKGLGLAALFVVAAFAGFHAAQLLAVFVQMVPLLIQLAGEYIMLAVDMGIAALAYVRQLIATTALVIVMASQMIPTLAAAAMGWIAEAAAMMIAIGPFILIGVLVAGAVVGLVLLIQHFGGLNAILAVGRAIWGALLPVFQQAGAAIRGAFLQAVQQLTPVWQQLMQAFNQARPTLMALGIVLGAILVGAIGVLVGVIRGLVAAFVALLVGAIHVVAGIIQAFAGVVQFFMGFFTVLHGIFTGNMNEIKAGFATMGSGILNIITGMWNAIKAVFVGAFNVIKAFVMGFVNGIIAFFHMLSSVLVGHSIVPDMMNAIHSVIMAGFAAVTAIVHAGINAIITVFNTMATMVSAAVNMAMSVLKALFTGGIAAAVAVVAAGVANVIARFESMPGPIGAVVRGAVSVVMTLGSGVENAAGIVAGAVGRVIGAFQSMAGGIAGAVSGAIGWVNNLIGAIHNIPGLPGGFHIPGFAAGGIVTGPTLAVIGEGSEPEIVLPMSKYQAAMEGAANVAVASKGGGNGSGQTIVNNFLVDGKVVASSVMNTLTGQLQMNGMGRMLR